MITSTPFSRIAKALSTEGIHAERSGDVVHVNLISRPSIKASILLPETLPLEARAVAQLLSFAAVSHPGGGQVIQTCATPDFHPGTLVPVGSVLVTSPDFVVPQAVGTDINCGMRLHVMNLTRARFLKHKEQLVALLRGDLLEGTRNVPTTPASMTALFGDGLGAFLDHAANIHEGLFSKADFRQMREEAGMLASRKPGKPEHAPENLQDRTRSLIRDPGLATLGSGNHFCEIQEVAEVLDRHAAYRMGIRPGQLAVMVHTGSRDVGFYVGQRWMDRARAAWPAGLKYPQPALFGLIGASAREYLGAMRAAANYADANRALVMELVRQRFRQVYGDLEMPLVCDVQHNMAFEEGESIVHRKGATPAHLGQALLIPGSMGDHSYLLEGLGNQAFASSASHGAGRSMSRGQAGRMNANQAAPYFECITLRQERRIEESPSAYKPVTPVVQSQVDNGLVNPVARLSPILTFKA